MPDAITKFYAFAVKDEKTGELILKVVNSETAPMLDGASRAAVAVAYLITE